MDDSSSELSNLMADEFVDYNDLEAVKLQKAILSLPTKQQLALTYDTIMIWDMMRLPELSVQQLMV